MLSDGAVNGVKHPIQVEGSSRHDLAIFNGQIVSTKERIVQDVSLPFTYEFPTDYQVWDFRGPRLPSPPNLVFLKDHFYKEGRLSMKQAVDLINGATDIMRNEPNLLKLSGSINICGDIHGQYYDLLQIFNVGGDPTMKRYLFLGDYVDRGKHSMECILFLYALKINYPDRIFLLRGNHESKHMTTFFSFRNECIQKYSEDVYEACIRSFQALPLAALLDEKYLCVHGGISPDLETPDDINTKIARFQEPPMNGLMCDLLWSDPAPDFDDETSDKLYEANGPRNVSRYFSFRAVRMFLERNRLFSIIRAHQVQKHGYRVFKNHIRESMSEGFASLISIFSAPNYVDIYNNQGAIIIYDQDKIGITQYNSVVRPTQLPNAFEWSLPFVAQKTSQILLSILDQFDHENLPYERQLAIRQKILTIGKFARVFSVLRANAEFGHRCKLSPEQYPYGPLMLGETGVSEEFSFEETEQIDRENEGNPDWNEYHPATEIPNLDDIIAKIMQEPFHM
ncbi:calcineurin [Dichotomocladium elegans]|nr:calcineurin [Dichotomocladium elegans]